MICGKEMKTLTRHLMTAHDMKPGAYRKQFGIPAGTALAAKDYSESRRQMAIDKDLGAGLAKARAARVDKKAAAKKPAVKKAAKAPVATEA
jgi:predicted transcriptional regulator